MNTYAPCTMPTMYFIGVTTGQSSSVPIFPAWMENLGVEGALRGVDFKPNSDPTLYREVVEFIKSDPLSLGSLITTHKLNLLKASDDLFDELDPYAQTLHEVSVISKRDGRLLGQAMDPTNVGEALDAIVPEGYWSGTDRQCLILGSGGSSLALTLNLHNRVNTGRDVPGKILVTARRQENLDEMKQIHAKIDFAIPVDYVLTPTPAQADQLISDLPPGSMVVNATGLGKDGPGSPTTDDVAYPKNAVVWEFNYRGELQFLRQARAQEAVQNLKVEDGWVYFIHSWTQVIAEVFDLEIPSSGPVFDELSAIARRVTA